MGNTCVLKTNNVNCKASAQVFSQRRSYNLSLSAQAKCSGWEKITQDKIHSHNTHNTQYKIHNTQYTIHNT